MNNGILTQGQTPPAMPYGLLGLLTPPPPLTQAWHPEALDWYGRVVANRGTASPATLAAVSNFCFSIDRAGLRSLLWRVNPMAGGNLAAVLVPLYRGPAPGSLAGNATDTNNNFVSGDYTETSGLVGNNSNKTLDTGLPQNFTNGRHIGMVPFTLATTSFRYYMGAKQAGNNNSLYAIYSGSPTTNIAAFCYSDTAATGGAASETGTAVAVQRRLHLFMNFSVGGTGPSGAVAYADGVRSGNNGFGFNTNSAVPIGVFGARQSDGTYQFPVNARISGYTIGSSMGAAQAGNYNAIWTAMLTALGRA